MKHQKVYCNDFLAIQILSQPTAYSLFWHFELGQITHLKANSGEIRLGVGGVLNFQQGVEKCVFVSATEFKYVFKIHFNMLLNLLKI